MAFDGSTIGAATTGSFVAGVFTDSFSVSGSDVDMVALTLTAGQLYRVDVDNGAVGDFTLRIFDQFGNEVRANDDGFRSTDDVVFSLSPYLDFVPNVTGTYYVAISPYYLDGYDPTTTAGRVAPENPLATTVGTLTVSAAGTAFWGGAGTISFAAETSSDLTDAFREEDESLRVAFIGAVDNAGDVDIARIDLNKNDIVVVDVNGLAGNGTVLRVFDGAGVQIGFDDDSGFLEDPELIFAAPAGGAYYIGISGEGNISYDPLDGTDTLAGAVGDYEVIVHRNPTQIGSVLANSFNASAGNDYIVGLAGNDTLGGNDGFDTLAGGDDNDSVSGGNGEDVLYGEQGNDTLDGGKGTDVLSGGIGDDSLLGGAGKSADRLDGGVGTDTLDGGAGDDTLDGGAGNDSIIGGSGNNAVAGGDGNDTVTASGDNDTIDGGLGADSIAGGGGLNLLRGGGDGDTVAGGGDADTLQGDAGNDTLNGSGGADLIEGGADNDSLLGGSGADTLRGGAGNDTLAGNQDADVFDFDAVAEAVDVITDFVLGTDDIDLVGIFGAGVVNAGNLSQFVQTSTSGISDSFLAVDANGLVGGLSFTIIAQVTGVTAAQLFDLDNFLL